VLDFVLAGTGVDSKNMPLKNRGFLGGDSDNLREIYDYI